MVICNGKNEPVLYFWVFSHAVDYAEDLDDP